MPTTFRPSPHPAATATGSLPLILGFAAAVIFFVLSCYNTYRNTWSLREGSKQVERANTVSGSIRNV